MMRPFRVFLTTALLCVALAVITLPGGRATAADLCLPTNGLMNLNDADDLLAGRVVLPASIRVELGRGDVNWNRPALDPESARLLFSLKWSEELVRRTRETGDDKYLDRAVAIALDFHADNPPDAGPDPDDAWQPMHAGQRTTTLTCLLSLTGDNRLREVIRAHGSWLDREAAGVGAWNQAIDPYLGLLMSGCSLGVAPWRTRAQAGLTDLIGEMIDPDGALLEQAPGYGRFVWARWGIVQDQLTECGMAVPTEIDGRRAALIEWLAWMSGPDGEITPTGDSFRSIVPPTPSGSFTAYTTSGGASGTAPSGLTRVFPAGYVAGRSSWSNLRASTYWTIRFGPGRNFHGHEDHTSVTFWSRGREVLVDSGHAGYGDTAYREALRSPEAHNVLMLPGVDFRDRRSTELTRSTTGSTWRFDEVTDDAYSSQAGRLVHAPRTRGVLVLPQDGVMVVHDAAERVEAGLFEQLWHLPPGSTVTSNTRAGIVARHPAGDVDIHLLQVPLPGQELPRGSTTVVEGQTNPFLGWVSRSNAQRETAPVVQMRRLGTETKMVTVIATTPVGGRLTATAQDVTDGWIIVLNLDGTERSIGVGIDGSMRIGRPQLGTLPLQTARRCSMSVTGSC